MLELEGVRSGYGKLEIVQAVAPGWRRRDRRHHRAKRRRQVHPAQDRLRLPAALRGPYRARRAGDRGAPARRDHAPGRRLPGPGGRGLRGEDPASPPAAPRSPHPPPPPPTPPPDRPPPAPPL